MLGEQLLGAFVLFVDHLQHFVVDHLCRSLRIGTLELILLVVVVADVGQTIAHAGIDNHSESTLRGAFQVVHGSRGNVTSEQFLGSTATQQGTHLVEHLLLSGDLALFRQIPSGTKCLATRHNADLYQWVGKFAEPRNGGMTGFVEGNGAFFGCSHHLGLFLQTSDDAVYGIEEVLLRDCLSIVTGGNKCCLVAYVGNIGT